MADPRTDLIEAFARELGTAPLTPPEIDAVLQLAAVSAHGTGDRTTAPLASFLAGIAAASAEDRLDAVERLRARAAELTPPSDS